MIVVGLKNKHWVVSYTTTKGKRRQAKFPVTKEGERKMKAEFAKHKISEVLCSSSLDFPEDGGMPSNFDAHKVLSRIAYRPPKEPETLIIEAILRADGCGDRDEIGTIAILAPRWKKIVKLAKIIEEKYAYQK